MRAGALNYTCPSSAYADSTHTGAACVCTVSTRIHAHTQSIRVHTHTHKKQDYCVRPGMLCVSARPKMKGIRMGKAFILLFRATGSWANQVAIPTFLCRWEASINQWKVVFRQEREVARRGGYNTMNACYLSQFLGVFLRNYWLACLELKWPPFLAPWGGFTVRGLVHQSRCWNVKSNTEASSRRCEQHKHIQNFRKSGVEDRQSSLGWQCVFTVIYVCRASALARAVSVVNSLGWASA